MSRTDGLDEAAAAAARMAGDGVTCTGYGGCRCPGCREDEQERADWAERANATVYAGRALEVSE